MRNSGSAAPRVRRTFSDPTADIITSTYTIECGDVIYTLNRQYFAQGQSLFDWELSGPGVLKNFPTKRAAVEFVPVGV